MLFPYVESIIDGVWYFSVMFLGGSILMLIRGGMEIFYLVCSCNFKAMNCITVIISFMGWMIFFVGSALGSPIFDFRNHRDKLYEGAALTILLVRLLRLIYLFKGKISTFCYYYYRLKQFILTEIFMCLSMVLFFIGTIIFYKSNWNQSLSVVGVPFYVLGGLSLLISSFYDWLIVFVNHINGGRVAEIEKPVRQQSTNEIIEFE